MTLADKIEPWTPNTGDMPERWAGHCNVCHEPITRLSRFERFRSWLAYRIWMALPLGFAPMKGSLLAWAGQYAFECACPNRAAALRAKEASNG